MESGGYMEMIEGAKGQYGILDYENWVIMHTCIASGFIPFREHTPDEVANFEENIFKLFENAKKVLEDQAALAEAFLIYCHTPEAAYKVAANAPGTLNPVVQMGVPEVLSQFSQDELDASFDPPPDIPSGFASGVLIVRPENVAISDDAPPVGVGT